MGAVRARMKGLAGQVHEAGRRRKLNIHPVDKQRLRGDAPSRRSITEWTCGVKRSGNCELKKCWVSFQETVFETLGASGGECCPRWASLVGHRCLRPCPDRCPLLLARHGFCLPPPTPLCPGSGLPDKASSREQPR